MVSKKIEDLFEFIESTANAIKILARTDLPQVRDAIEGKTSLPEGCPTRASLAEFCLRGLAGRVDELETLIQDLMTEIAKEYSDEN